MTSDTTKNLLGGDGSRPRSLARARARGLLLNAAVVGSALIMVGCNGARAVPVASECGQDVTFTFKGAPSETWNPAVVTPEGTSLGASEEVDRVWYEAADGTILNEVSLTAEEMADTEVDFPTLVIKSEHCDQLASEG